MKALKPAIATILFVVTILSFCSEEYTGLNQSREFEFLQNRSSVRSDNISNDDIDSQFSVHLAYRLAQEGIVEIETFTRK